MEDNTPNNEYQPINSAQPPAIQTPPVSPIVEPAASTALAGVTPPSEHSSPGLLVLQWLTYAFWGWTVLSMAILSATVLASFIGNADTGSFTPYGIAAVLVLLPIAIACDIFYSKQEPVKKTGPASLVMIIHAVLFALFGIASLIAIVVSIVSLFTSSGDTSATQVALYSAMIITTLYVVVFLRTINPEKMPWIRRFFPIFMAVTVGIITILGIVGPVATARLTRTDKLIENSLNLVEQDVDDYARTNNRLPRTLSDIGLKGDAQKLVDDNLVTYTANTKPVYAPSRKQAASSGSYAVDTTSSQVSTTYFFELCVSYKKASSNFKSNSYSNVGSDGYSDSLIAYQHPAGNICYKLKSTNYNY